MKTTLRLGLWTACLLGTIASVNAQNLVTFQVNMGVQTSQGNFDPTTNTVEARGDFNNWSGGFTLTNSTANPDIYSGSYSFAAGSVGTSVAYKFVYVRDGNANWETLGNNRTFTLQDGGQTLDVVYFSDISPVQETTSVTFQVDMSVQAAERLFDSTSDTVEARGGFNGWSGGFTLTPSATNADVYVGTTDITGSPGAQIEYKFVEVKNGNANWETRGNRAFTLQSTNQTLDVVYFDDASVVVGNIQAAVLFAVDMNVQIATGNFDTNSDEVYVRGNKMGWDVPPSGFQLFEDATHAGVYTNTYETDTQLVGEQFQFKFTIWRPNTAATVWEDGNNKILVFDGTEPLNTDGYHQLSYGPVFFNGITFSDVLSEDTLVTFSVNMTNAVRMNGTPFDPASEGVWINGSFFNPWWGWNTMPSEDQMVDDGTGADKTSGDLIYTWQYQFTKGQPTQITYKYGIESGDNEAASGSNHVRFIGSVGSYVMPLDTFGVMFQESPVSTLSIQAASGGGHITVAWEGRPGVHLQRATSLLKAAWQDVADTDGKSSITLTAEGGTSFFRLVKP